jgi:hypothetical protein
MNKKYAHTLMIIIVTLIGISYGITDSIFIPITIGWIVGYVTGVICEHEPSELDEKSYKDDEQ